MDTDAKDFIRQRIEQDQREDKLPCGVVTRFPPEPNGYLHIGHAKSICLNFGVAKEFGGKTLLRFDDTNPIKESEDYVAAIQADVAWLGFEWSSLTHASDYFEELYKFANDLIRADKAFVCSMTAQQMHDSRGSLTESGTNSPYRDRSVSENLDLFARMRAGEFGDGEHVLRAKIDMSSPNINMRDPVLYRIRHVTHQRTGDDWCIYPMYDFTHCICDALEGITHSLCTLEFEDHRPLYDWVLDNANVNFHPPQIEFSRLGLEYTVLSKRLLNRLVEEKLVDGWDDPRMPTIAGLRRRGVTAAAIRDFCSRIGVTKQNNQVEMNLLEFCIRRDLEASARRGMGVVKPLLVTITNWSSDTIVLEGPWHARNESMGKRDLPFSGSLYIERDDFVLDPAVLDLPGKWKRLAPGEMVRLRYAFIIRCDEYVVDDNGEVIELKCTYFPDSRSGQDSSGLKPNGVVHWVSASHAVPVEIRSYQRLFNSPSPSAASLLEDLNSQSLLIDHGFVEPGIMAHEDRRFQFERQGYYCKDDSPPTASKSGPPNQAVFNKTVSLREGF
ncbi:MAG: glutamine--tRNA ligase/YqeY domain fusion protein [Gammaproteobacteria bacterium]|nr:glutamine--tRNA ligase/YqeY domain fusion protein [Gammaproteobacteria bacterium]